MDSTKQADEYVCDSTAYDDAKQEADYYCSHAQHCIIKALLFSKSTVVKVVGGLLKEKITHEKLSGVDIRTAVVYCRTFPHNSCALIQDAFK